MLNAKVSSNNNWAAELSALPELQRVVTVFYYMFRHFLCDWPEQPVWAARAAKNATAEMLGERASRLLPGIAEVFVRRFVVWTDQGELAISESQETTDLERVHLHATRFGIRSAKRISVRTGIPRSCVSNYLTHLKKTGFSIPAAQQSSGPAGTDLLH